MQNRIQDKENKKKNKEAISRTKNRRQEGTTRQNNAVRGT